MNRHRPKNNAKNIVATPVVKPSHDWIVSRLTNESILGRSPTNVPAATRSFKQSQTLINISRRMRHEPSSARLPVVGVAKHFTTTHLSTLMFAPHINNNNNNNNRQTTVNTALQPQMTHQLRKRTRSLLILLLDQPPLKHPLLVPAGKLILFSSLPTLFQVAKHILLTCTDNTGHKSGPDSAAKTDFKIGIIFVCRRSVQPASATNSAVFLPFVISTPDDLERTIQEISNIDFLFVRQQRPNSKWVVDLVTNVTWFVWKIRDHPIGRGKYLPSYIVENRGIAPLDRNIQRGKPYEDNLCFFRCLALHNGCHTKNLERDTKYYYQQYREAELRTKKFHGVKLSELDDLEKLSNKTSKCTFFRPHKPTVKTKAMKNTEPTLPPHFFADHFASMKAHSS